MELPLADPEEEGCPLEPLDREECYGEEGDAGDRDAFWEGDAHTVGLSLASSGRGLFRWAGRHSVALQWWGSDEGARAASRGRFPLRSNPPSCSRNSATPGCSVPATMKTRSADSTGAARRGPGRMQSPAIRADC